MKRFCSILSLLFLMCATASSQLSVPEMSSSLGELFTQLNRNTADSSRYRINESIRSVVESYVASDTIFRFNLEDVRFLGQITSPDSMLKIVTWNLPLEDYRGEYYSYVVRRGGKGEKNKVYPLAAPYNGSDILTDTTYTGADWYGALYYDIRPFTSEGTRYWVVLGLNQGDPQVTRKLIDVISFDDNSDSVIFGKKWFLNSRPAHRVVFRYASTGMMTLRFASSTEIIFDHLVPVAATPDNRVLYGPDYSYDSYTFADNKWTFSLNVDARNKE